MARKKVRVKQDFKLIIEEHLVKGYTCECCSEGVIADYQHKDIVFQEDGLYKEKKFIEMPRFLCSVCYEALPVKKRKPPRKKPGPKPAKKKRGGPRENSGRPHLPSGERGIKARYYIPPSMKPELDAIVVKMKREYIEERRKRLQEGANA